MAVALRGYTQAVYASSGTQTIAWPAGTVVGDFAVLCLLEPQSGTPNSAPVDATPWKVGPSTGNSTVWGAPVTTALLAASLPVKGNVAYLATFSGCSGIGRTSKSNGVQVTNAGGGLFVFVRDDSAGTLTPAGGKLGTDVLNGKNRNRRSNVWFVAQATTGFKKLSSTNASYFTSLELVPAVAPSAPTLISPSDGAYLNPSVTNTFTGRHNHPTMPQSRINLQIREKTGPGAWQYLRPDGTLNATSGSSATSSPTMPLNPGQLSTGTYEWQMQTAVDDSGSPMWSPWSASSTLIVAAPPVVTSVSVSAPAEDVTPDVTAARTLGVGSQVAWQLRVTPSASTGSDQATVWDSLVQAGDTLAWTLPALAWANGASYKVWVRIQQTGGQWSAWTSGTFIVSWTAPGAPSAVSYAAGTPPTVTVAGVASRNYVQVAYSEDAGVTWVTDTTRPVTANPLTVSLPLAPYGVPRRYRARASVTIDGTEQYSAWTQDQPVELRRNACRVPRAATSWGVFAGTGGTVTPSVPADARWKGGVARRGVWTVAGTGSGYVSCSGAATMAVGETWMISMRVAVVGYTGALGLTVGGGNHPTVTYAALNTIDNGDGTLTLWRTVTCTSLGAGTGDFVFLTSLTNGQVGHELWAGDAIAEKGATSFAGYFDGGYSPDPRGLPSWTGAANGSPSILSDSQASTDRGAYLVGDDGAYLAVKIRQDAPRRRVQPISVTYGLVASGTAPMAAVDIGPARGWAGSTRLLAVLPSDQAAIIAFWDERPAFAIRWPAETRGASICDAGWTRVTRISEIESARVVQDDVTLRDLDFDWVEQP